MFKFLIFFVLFVFIFGLSTLWRRLRELFGTNPQNRQQNQQQNQQAPTNQKKRSSTGSKKIIASDEGEYVDYVEIKD